MSFRNLMILLYVLVNLLGCLSTSCPRRLNKVEEGRKCKKPCTDDVQCRSPNKTCSCDDACGMSCYNTRAECDEDPPSIANGNFRTSNGKLMNSRASYYCSAQYILKGNRKIFCRADKQWHPKPPSCTRGCSRPYSVGFAYVSSDKSSFTSGESVTYKCLTGRYQRDRSTKMTRMCTPTGQWSRAEFSCLLQRCVHLPEVLNGRIEYTPLRRDVQQFGDAARLTCILGYTPTNDNSLISRCINGDRDSSLGRWTREELSRCHKIPCPPPRRPTYGSIGYRADHRNEYDNIIDYECNFGYKLEGNSRGRCNENSSWGELPKCAAIVNCSFTEPVSPTCGYLASNWRRQITWSLQYAESSSVEGSLTSPEVVRQYTESNHVCLRFRYNLPRIGSLRVELIGGGIDEALWSSLPVEERLSWLESFVNIPLGPKIQYKFVANGRYLKLDDILLNRYGCEDHCQPNPCLNGGTCVNRHHRFQCYCTVDYKGDRCEIDRKCPEPTPHPLNAQEAVIAQEARDMLLPGTKVQFRCIEHFKAPRLKPIRSFLESTCVERPFESVWSPLPRNMECFDRRCVNPPINLTYTEDVDIRYVSGRTLLPDSIATYRCQENYKVSGISYFLDAFEWDCTEYERYSRWIPNVESNGCEGIVNCSFTQEESQTCGYLNNNWRRVSSRIWFSSEKYAESTSTEATLTSPEIVRQYSKFAQACLKFKYYLPNSGSLKVKLLGSDGNAEIWSSHPNDVKDDWLESFVNIRLDEKIQYQFAVNARHVRLDDIFLNRHECDDHCQDNPCQNGGTCVNRPHDFKCFCTVDYKGRTCTTDRKCSNIVLYPGNTQRVVFVRGSRDMLLPSTQVRFTCKEHFKAPGLDPDRTYVESTCTERRYSSVWDPQLRDIRCVDRRCLRLPQRLPYTEDVNITYTKENVLLPNTVVTYRCLQHYKVSSVGSFTTVFKSTCTEYQTDSRWIPDVNGVGCEEIFCPSPPLVDGHVLVNFHDGRWHIDDEAIVTCKERYRFPSNISKTRITCKENGVWSGTFTSCEVDYCHDGPCRNGGTCINKPNNYTCLCPIDYKGSVCEIDRKCPTIVSYPGNTQEVVFVRGSRDMLLPSTQVRFPCKEYFKAPGLDPDRAYVESTCSEGEYSSVWNPQLGGMRCVDRRCPPLPRSLAHTEDVNITYTKENALLPNTVVTYRCLQHYKVSRVDSFTTVFESTCTEYRAGSRWIPEVDGARCEEILCPSPPLVKGHILVNFHDGRWHIDDEAVITCKERYRFPSNISKTRITCKENGVWSGTFTSCEVNYCYDGPCRNGGTCINKPNKYTCLCPMDYKGSVCEIDRKCQPPAQRLVNTKNYNITYTKENVLLPNTVVTYRCLQHYKVSRVSSFITVFESMCTEHRADSRWIPEVNGAECEEILCPNPPLAEGHVLVNFQDGRWRIDDEAVVTCEEKFWFPSNVSKTRITCRENGVWSGTFTRCEVDYCFDGPCLNGGTCINKPHEFMCLCPEDYKGTRCEIDKKCALLPKRLNNTEDFDVVHSSKSFQHPHTVLIYGCLPNHKVSGIVSFRTDLQLTCTEYTNGSRWMPDDYHAGCEEITCPNPPLHKSRFLVSESDKMYDGRLWHIGDVAVVRCKTGYRLKNDTLKSRKNRAKCRSNGTWTNNFTKCEGVPCPNPQQPQHGNFAYRGDQRNKYGSTIDYRCDFGYKLEGKSWGRCNENGTWGEIPICTVAVNCTFTNESSPTCGYLKRDWSRHSEPGSNYAESTSAAATLTSPVVTRQYTDSDEVCLKFKYFLPSNNGSLRIKFTGTRTERDLWSSHLNERRNMWLESFVNIPLRVKMQYQFIANVSSVKLDNIVLKKHRCENHCNSSNQCLNDGMCINRPDDFTCICLLRYKGDKCEIDTRCHDPYLTRNFTNVIANVDQKEDTFMPSKVIVYQCLPNYKVSGTNSFITAINLTCTENETGSTWISNVESDKCEEITCPRPPLETNHVLVDDRKSRRWLIGDEAVAKCKQGYRFRGKSPRRRITCGNNGRWNDTFSNCEVSASSISCSRPRQIEHGMIMSIPLRDRYEYNSTIKYGCNFGYLIDGERYTRCNENSMWSELPKCAALVNCTFSNAKGPTCGYAGKYWRTVGNWKGNNPAGYTVSLWTRATLTSPIVDRYYADGGKACLRFENRLPWQGSLSVELKVDGKRGKSVWRTLDLSQKRTSDRAWGESYVNIPLGDETSYRIVANQRSLAIRRIFLDKQECGKE